jgi:hypothetical protein
MPGLVRIMADKGVQQMNFVHMGVIGGLGIEDESLLNEPQLSNEILAETQERTERGGGACGYVLGRDGRTATHLGPLVAESEGVARALAGHALERITTAVTIDAADAAPGFTDWLAASGFARERPFTRMYRGRSSPFGDPGLTAAIAGPELG